MKITLLNAEFCYIRLRNIRSSINTPVFRADSFVRYKSYFAITDFVISTALYFIVGCKQGPMVPRFRSHVRMEDETVILYGQARSSTTV